MSPDHRGNCSKENVIKPNKDYGNECSLTCQERRTTKVVQRIAEVLEAPNTNRKKGPNRGGY